MKKNNDFNMISSSPPASVKKRSQLLLSLSYGCPMLLFGVFWGTNNCSAQSLSPEVVATQGDYFTSSGGALSWTLGELMGETYAASGNILTQGFQQPNLLLTQIDPISNVSFASVFPNPIIAQLNVVSKTNGNFTVVDLLGQQVGSWAVTAGKTEIDLSFLAAGVYQAMLINENNQKQTFKLSKTK